MPPYLHTAILILVGWSTAMGLMCFKKECPADQSSSCRMNWHLPDETCQLLCSNKTSSDGKCNETEEDTNCYCTGDHCTQKYQNWYDPNYNNITNHGWFSKCLLKLNIAIRTGSPDDVTESNSPLQSPTASAANDDSNSDAQSGSGAEPADSEGTDSSDGAPDLTQPSTTGSEVVIDPNGAPVELDTVLSTVPSTISTKPPAPIVIPTEPIASSPVSSTDSEIEIPSAITTVRPGAVPVSTEPSIPDPVQSTSSPSSRSSDGMVARTGSNRPLRKPNNAPANQLDYRGTSLEELKRRVDARRKSKRGGFLFKWWYSIIVLCVMVSLVLLGVVAWSAATRKKRSEKYWKNKKEADGKGKKASGLARKPSKDLSKDAEMETLPESIIAKKGPHHLQKKMIGGTAHLGDNQVSASIHDNLEFVPELNEEVQIGSDVEIIDGIEFTTYEEPTIDTHNDNTVRMSSSASTVKIGQ